MQNVSIPYRCHAQQLRQRYPWSSLQLHSQTEGLMMAVIKETQNERLDGKSVTKGKVQTGRIEGQRIAKVKSAITFTVTQASKTHPGWKDKRACGLQLIIEHRHDELHASTLGAVSCTLVWTHSIICVHTSFTCLPHTDHLLHGPHISAKCMPISTHCTSATSEAIYKKLFM